MGRPWRIQFPGAIYHVTARGNNRQAIFLDDDDRSTFLELIDTACTNYDLDVFAFCLMGNHYHLFLRTTEGNLSKSMHWLNSTYTKRFHSRHHRSGHLFQGRYNAVLVVDEAHWLMLSMYIHLNPVRAGLANDPAAYQWSSFTEYSRMKKRFRWLMPDYVLASYGNSDASRRRRYRKECLMLAGQKPDFWQELRRGIFLGPQEVFEQIEKKHRPEGKKPKKPEASPLPMPEIDIEQELEKVAGAFDLDPGDLFMKRRDFSPKLFAYYHLVENCGLEAVKVSMSLGVSSTAVRRGVNRFKDILIEDGKMAKLMRRFKN